MTLFKRAAAVAALTLSITSLLFTGTPGFAAELDRNMQVAQVAGDNTSALLSIPEIPADDAVVASDPDFDTLDAAVAAQDAATADEALRCLAGAIYFEAKGEPLSGQLAVAEVILNRARSGRFPTDLCGVVTQRGQFGFVRGGEIPSIDATRAAWKRAVAVAKVALADSWNSPASDALYFNTANRRPGTGVVKIAAIGNHVFYR